MSDQVFIRDLLVRGIIGIYDWERQEAQDILINLILTTDLHQAGKSDALVDSIDYHALAKRVQAHVEQAKRYTVEALAADLAILCLEDQRVQSVRVRIEKPGAVRFARSVGVEIERQQGGTS